MKKAISLIMIMLILTSTFSVATVHAEEPAAPTQATEAPEPLPDVPQVRVTTNDGVGLSIKKADGYVDASVTITDTNGSEITGACQFKVRGNSTAAVNKKPYTFKLSKKTDVLGMGKAKKWALLANMFDPTLLRNCVAIGTAAQLGLDYTSMWRVVELWVDDSYRGCYLLIEPVQEGSTRVDIDIESNGGKADFLIEREYNRVEADATYFKTDGIRFVCDEPEAPTDEQLAYITGTMDDIIDTLKNGSREQIASKIDISSFAKYYLLNEFVKTVDFDYSSVFFYYKSGRLYAGPAWDYDLAMGNEDVNASANYAAANKTDDLYCNTKHLYKWLCTHDWFFDAVRAEYLKNAAYLDAVGADGGVIDSLYDRCKTPIDDNFKKAGWHTYAYYPGLNRRPSSVYTENLNYLRTWCAERAAWLKGYFTEDVEEYLLGDSDTDGSLTIFDTSAIQRKLVDLAVGSYDVHAADADGDGAVTILDATGIQRHLAGVAENPQIGKTVFRKS